MQIWEDIDESTSFHELVYMNELLALGVWVIKQLNQSRGSRFSSLASQLVDYLIRVRTAFSDNIMITMAGQNALNYVP